MNNDFLENLTSIEKAREIINDMLDERDIMLEKIRSLMWKFQREERSRLTMNHRLLYNGITGLANHRKMDSDMAPLFWEFFRYKNPPRISVFIVKLDDKFRHSSQSFNEEVVNNLLYTIASRLKTMTSQRGLLYHSRTDEFTIFIFDSLPEEDLRSIAIEIKTVIATVIENEIYKLKIGSHIGIATFPDDGLNKRMLLSSADIALNNAVARNLDIVFFKNDMRMRVIGNLEMQNNLLSAIEVSSGQDMEKNFKLFFQPIITVSEIGESGVKAESIKAEVLIRWHDINRGSLLPQNLIEVAEETGLIIPIGRWLIESAMKQLVIWQKTFSDLQLSINISPRQFFNSNFSEELKDLAEQTRVNPSDIFLEITESCLFDDEKKAVEEIEDLNKTGFRISLDDFGTGYSSLGYLNRFKTDVLKIDKVFTEGLLEEGKKRDVIKSIVRIAEEWKMDVVFEGIESLNQLEKAYELGCRTFQGYLFSKPLDSEGFTSFMNSNSSEIIPFKEYSE